MDQLLGQSHLDSCPTEFSTEGPPTCILALRETAKADHCSHRCTDSGYVPTINSATSSWSRYCLLNQVRQYQIDLSLNGNFIPGVSWRSFPSGFCLSFRSTGTMPNTERVTAFSRVRILWKGKRERCIIFAIGRPSRFFIFTKMFTSLNKGLSYLSSGYRRPGPCKLWLLTLVTELTRMNSTLTHESLRMGGMASLQPNDRR